MGEETFRLQDSAYPDEGSNLSSLQDTKSLLQALAAGGGELEEFSAFDWDSDGGYSRRTNYRSSNDTPDRPEGKESDTSPTPEPELTRQEHLEPVVEEERPLTPEVKEERPPSPKEEEKPPTPKEHQRPPTPEKE